MKFSFGQVVLEAGEEAPDGRRYDAAQVTQISLMEMKKKISFFAVVLEILRVLEADDCCGKLSCRSLLTSAG